LQAVCSKNRNATRTKKEKKMKTTRTVFSAIVIVMITSLVAGGNVQDFYNEADFLAAVSFPLDMESFEGLMVDNNTHQHINLTLADFTIVSNDLTLSVWDRTCDWGGHATDGIKHIQAGSTTNQLDFYLNEAVKAFGLNIIDWGDFGTGALTYSMDGQGLFTVAVSPLPSENELFFGTISTQEFNHVTLSHNISGESYSIDEAYYGIPEPATMVLLGLGSLVLFRKRRA
jgi:hypothetical protein